MATVDLQVTSIVTSTGGWSGATVANVDTSNDTRETGGVKNDVINCEIDNVPGDFGSMNSVTLHVEGKLASAPLLVYNFQIELLDGVDAQLETFTSANLSATEVTHNSSGFTRTDIDTVINAWRLRVTLLVGGGMPDGDTGEIDHMWVTLDYNLPASFDIIPLVGSLTLSTAAPTLDFGFNIPSEVLTLSTAAPTVDVTAHHPIEVPSASLILTALGPTLDFGFIVPKSDLVLSTDLPTVFVTDFIGITVSSGALNFTTVAPTLDFGFNIPSGVLALLTASPTLDLGFSIQSGSLNITTEAPVVAVTANHSIEVPSSVLSLSTVAPTVTTIIPHDITVPSGVLALTSVIPLAELHGFVTSEMKTKNSYTPPWSYKGNLYAALVTINKILIYKSTDSGVNWLTQASYTPANAVESIWTEVLFQTGELHIATQEDNGRVGYSIFDLEADALTTTNELIAEPGSEVWFVAAPSEEGVSFKFRSDGDTVLFLRHQSTSDQELRVWTREGSTWTDRGVVDTALVKGGCIAVGPDSVDRIYCFYNGNGSDLNVRALLSNNTLGSAALIDGTVEVGSLYNNGQGFVTPSDVVWTTYIKPNDNVTGAHFAAADNPSSPTNAVEVQDVANNVLGNGASVEPFTGWSYIINGADQHLIMINSADQDVYVNKNEVGTDTEIHDTVTANAIAATIQSDVLRYFWDNNGVIVYNQRTVNIPLANIATLGVSKFAEFPGHNGPFEI